MHSSRRNAMTSTEKKPEARSAVRLVFDWWIATTTRWAREAELRALPPEELHRVAADFGVSTSELLEASARPQGSHELLDRRLVALDLTPDAIWEISPAVLRDLQRTCSACPERERCKDDMDEISPLAPGWESYCPNSGTLRTLT